MKLDLKHKAIELRKAGYSLKEIKDTLEVSKSSISKWVRDVELSQTQRERLAEKGHLIEVVEKRRLTRIQREKARRQFIINRAERDIKKLSNKELWLIGVMLYWAEGSKTNRGIVQFTNSDPEMIKLMMAFFRNICQVPEEKFRGHIHIHPHLDYKASERYWASIIQLPLKRFYKTYRKMNKASKQKRDTLPYGTLDIYICNTELFLKICGWVNGIYHSYRS